MRCVDGLLYFGLLYLAVTAGSWFEGSLSGVVFILVMGVGIYSIRKAIYHITGGRQSYGARRTALAAISLVAGMMWLFVYNGKTSGITGIISTALPLIVITSPIWLAVGLYLAFSYHQYKKSSYRVASGNGFLRVRLDKGAYGEYLTYRILEGCPGYKRLLANVYLPKEDGSTTEVDVVMLSEAGVFVFESKNYSWWIFGDEKSKMWTQVLNKHTKNKLYNPIWQNRGHISAMQKALSELSIEDSLFRLTLSLVRDVSLRISRFLRLMCRLLSVRTCGVSYIEISRGTAMQ